MGSFQASWEDEENNRRVDLVVDYRIAAGQVEIASVTPQRVYFSKSRAAEPFRSVGVWTEKGRQLLAAQAKAAGFVDRVRHQIAESDIHDVRHAADTVHDPAEAANVTV